MAATRENKRIEIVVSQQELNVGTSTNLYPTQSQLITFGSYFKGDDGITPHIDSTTGNWFIGDVDTGVKAQGVDGQDGVTPHIDQVSGNWFIGNVDTGVHAQGEKGEKGDDGVGIPQTLSIDGNSLSISYGNSVNLPPVHNATLTIQKNGTTVDTFTANASVDKTINIIVPTKAADVNALPDTTKYATSILLTINSSTYVMTFQLKDQDGRPIGSAQSIDLPLETMVIGGEYDEETKMVILTLKNGQTIEFSIADLIRGLQAEITVDNPLSADLLTDGEDNKVYTAAEQNKLEGIEAGAEVNVQSDWSQTDTAADDFIKNQPPALKDSAIIPSTLVDGTVIENVVQDYDGNWYNGVVMNNQIWLKENLRVTHNPSGDSIEYYHANGDSSNDETYGLLYDWNTMMNRASSSTSIPSGVQGIAPNGWHIPSYQEWNAFCNYIGSNPEYRIEEHYNWIAKSIASKLGWNDSTIEYAVGNNLSKNNATGFNIMPSGCYDGNGYYLFGKKGRLWSTTIYNGRNSPYTLNIDYYSVYTSMDIPADGYYYSVRCVMDMSASDWFAANRNRLYLKNTSSGFVWSQLSEVAESGSYNALKDKPTIPSAQVQSDWNQLNSSEPDFIKNKPTIPDAQIQTDWEQTDSTSKDYLKNMPNAFRNRPAVSAVDGTVILNIVQDYDGNWYSGVVMNDKIWLRENLKTTHFSDGTAIELGSSASTTTPYRYYPNNNSDNVDVFGYLYNWPAVMNGESSSTDNPSEIQGIAPTGCHIPSKAEIEEFIAYIGTKPAYILNSDSTYIAKAIAAKNNWNESTNAYAPGNDLSTNDATNFCLIPAGYYVYGSYSAIEEWSILATSTAASNADSHWGLYTKSHLPYTQVLYGGDNMGESVRCVLDMSATEYINTYRSRLYLKNNSDAMTWVQLSSIAESGSYNDLKDKPTIPAAQVNSDWNASSGVAQILNKPSLATVATSGNYNDLGNKPSIPTLRTMNGEQLTNSILGDINIHDGFYFPNAVQDYDGNWYGAVVIGNQVWLGENLRTTHYNDGTTIENIYNNIDSDISLEKRGLLYKYTSAVNNSSSLDTRIECMFDNWFVPTREDFNDLVSYLNKQKRFSYNEGDFYYQAKSLASNSYWQQSSTPDAVGYNLSENNKTGFNCYPTGYYMTNYGVISPYSYAQLWMVRTSIFPNGGYGGLVLASSGKQAQISNTDSTIYHPLRCISNLTPIKFRNWYIEQYGSLQHTLAETNVQSDWNQSDNTADDYIKNKPTLGTASALDVSSSGNASSTQVVKGDDTRLESDTFVCNYNLSNNTVDKTPEEIYNAYIAGKTVLCKSGPTTMYLTQTDVYNTDSYYLRFQQIINPQLTPVQLNYLTYFNNAWSLSARNLQPQLIGSGTGQNIKTINNESILGSGDITITASGINAIPSSEKGANNGVAELGSDGKVPSSQLPSYVDDVLEYASSSSFPATGESGKIYIALDTNLTYRWSGSAYVEISQSLALGETSSTAYAGNKGKANADAIDAIKDGTSIDSFADVEAALPTAAQLLPAVTSTDNGKILIVDSGAWAATAIPVADAILYPNSNN